MLILPHPPLCCNKILTGAALWAPDPTKARMPSKKPGSGPGRRSAQISPKPPRSTRNGPFFVRAIFCFFWQGRHLSCVEKITFWCDWEDAPRCQRSLLCPRPNNIYRVNSQQIAAQSSTTAHLTVLFRQLKIPPSAFGPTTYKSSEMLMAVKKAEIFAH